MHATDSPCIFLRCFLSRVFLLFFFLALSQPESLTRSGVRSTCFSTTPGHPRARHPALVVVVGGHCSRWWAAPSLSRPLSAALLLRAPPPGSPAAVPLICGGSFPARRRQVGVGWGSFDTPRGQRSRRSSTPPPPLSFHYSSVKAPTLRCIVEEKRNNSNGRGPRWPVVRGAAAKSSLAGSAAAARRRRRSVFDDSSVVLCNFGRVSPPPSCRW